MTLNINDLGTVSEALFDTRSKAYNIGLMLKVPVGTLDSIKLEFSNPANQLTETLKAWLKMAPQQKWQTVVEMLRSRMINEPTLASDIEAEYCQGTPEPAQLQAKDQQVEQLQESQRQVQQQLLELKLQLQSSTQSRETTKRLQRELQELQCAIEAIQIQVEQLIEQLPSTKRPSARPQPKPPQQETTLRKLIWRDGPKAPEAMRRGSVATDGTTVYFNGLDSTKVHQYHRDTQQWRTLPNLPHIWSTLVMAESTLISVGGCLRGKVTASLLTLTRGWFWGKKWLEDFPPMITKRYFTAAICHGRSLITAGGYNGLNFLATVEVFNMDTRLWSTASSLPHPFSYATASICGENLYVLGGWDQTRGINSAFTCSISKLLHSCQTLSQSTIIWQRFADVRYKGSSCATLCGQLVAVGGIDEAKKDTTAVSAYDEKTDSWLAMEAMKTPRWCALVASLHDNTMMVVGGSCLDTVEIANVS